MASPGREDPWKVGNLSSGRDPRVDTRLDAKAGHLTGAQCHQRAGS